MDSIEYIEISQNFTEDVKIQKTVFFYCQNTVSSGGALFFWGSNNLTNKAEISDSSFYHCSSTELSFGGAIYSHYTSLTLSSVCFNQCYASDALFVYVGLTNYTIFNHTSSVFISKTKEGIKSGYYFMSKTVKIDYFNNSILIPQGNYINNKILQISSPFIELSYINFKNNSADYLANISPYFSSLLFASYDSAVSSSYLNSNSPYPKSEFHFLDFKSEFTHIIKKANFIDNNIYSNISFVLRGNYLFDNIILLRNLQFHILFIEMEGFNYSVVFQNIQTDNAIRFISLNLNNFSDQANVTQTIMFSEIPPLNMSELNHSITLHKLNFEFDVRCDFSHYKNITLPLVTTRLLSLTAEEITFIASIVSFSIFLIASIIVYFIRRRRNDNLQLLED